MVLFDDEIMLPVDDLMWKFDVSVDLDRLLGDNEVILVVRDLVDVVVAIVVVVVEVVVVVISVNLLTQIS